MQLQHKKIWIRVLLYSNLLLALLLLIAALPAVFPPSITWVPSVLCLGIPFMIIILLLFAAGWFFVQRRRIWISVAALLLTLPFTYSVFSFHPFTSFHHQKAANTIRVLTWNVELMNYEAKDSATASDKNKVILDSLSQIDADVICLQEFFTSVVPGDPYNIIDSISRVFHYPYRYFIHEHAKFNESFYSGNIIFSRYPIVDSSAVVFKGSFRGAILQVGLLIGSDTVDVINTRLQSFQLDKQEYDWIDDSDNKTDSSNTGNRNLISKLRSAFLKREEQADQLAAMIDNIKRPLIVTADLNDVPASYAYSKLGGRLHDAWLNKGFGMGRTFRFISPSLRIDHIFYSDEIKTQQIKRIMTGSSDHDGLVADVSLKR